MDAEHRPQLRAGDAEREVTLERLRTAHAEGRLDVDEFYARMDSVYTARTFGDLDALLTDLPAAGVEHFPAPPRSARPTGAVTAAPASSAGGLLGAMPPQLRAVWGTWATVVSINVVVWLLIAVFTRGAPPYFWPVWVAGPWGIVNLGLTASWWLNRGEDGGAQEIGPA